MLALCATVPTGGLQVDLNHNRRGICSQTILLAELLLHLTDIALGGLRIQVEIEAEFLEPDLTNTDIHHLIHVRKILKLGSGKSQGTIKANSSDYVRTSAFSDQSLELVQTQILVPLTKKKAMPYYRALAEVSWKEKSTTF